MSSTTETPKVKSEETSSYRLLSGKIGRFAFVFCVIVSLIHIWYNSFGLIDVVKKSMLHISLMMAIIFLIKPANSRSPKNRPSVPDWILFVLSLGVGIYLLAVYNRLVESFLQPNIFDNVYGVIFLILIIEAARRTVGWPLTLLSVMFLVYIYVGPYMPGIFAHQGFSLKRIFIRMTMTSEGVLGIGAMVSASYIFMFILFASFLKVTRASEFFNELALALTGRARGGPAKVAIFASALTGTISGSSQANVATTGSFTIPLMKSIGYQPYFAGAVEAIASTGGVLTPPIMGAAAFIMSSYLGISYNKIMLAGIAPAILYYFTLYNMVDLRAAKIGLVGMNREQLPDLREVLKEKGHMILPLVLIILFLIIGFSPLLAAFIGIISVLVVSSFRKVTRLSWQDILFALNEGARNGAIIAIICGIIGFIIASVGMTGVGQVIGSNVVKWSGGQLWLTSILCMITAVILGMGLPGPACYIITATIAAPALVQIGVPMLAAHFFAFYFGTMSAVVPPVALTSYTAAAIAKDDPNRVAFTGLLLGSAGILLPYMYVYSPVLLGINFHWFHFLTVFITSLAGLYSITIVIIGHLKWPVTIIERFFFAVAAILLVSPSGVGGIAGLGIFGTVYAYHMLQTKKHQ